jgi:hypothetical protein
MKTSLPGALAVVALGSLAYAGTEAESTWRGLDEEIHALASSFSLDGSDVQMGAVVRSRYTFSRDFSTSTGATTSGMTIDTAQLWAGGRIGDAAWRLSADFGAESANDDPFVLSDGNDVSDAALGIDGMRLLDAYGTWHAGEHFQLTLGHFSAPLLFSTEDGPDRLLFIERSALGRLFYTWDLGLMASTSFNRVRLAAGLQNGLTGVAEEFAVFARVELDLSAYPQRSEGAFDSHSTQEFQGTLGFFVLDDSSLDAGTAFGVDGRIAAGPFSLAAEGVVFDDDWTGPLTASFGVPYAGDGPTLYSVTAGYMILAEEWEIALRYEHFDSESEDQRWTTGINWYLSGHNAKWQFNYVVQESDDVARDGDLFQLGLTLGLNS